MLRTLEIVSDIEKRKGVDKSTPFFIDPLCSTV